MVWIIAPTGNRLNAGLVKTLRVKRHKEEGYRLLADEQFIGEFATLPEVEAYLAFLDEVIGAQEVVAPAVAEAWKPGVDWEAFGGVRIIDPEDNYLVHRPIIRVDQTSIHCCTQGELFIYRLSDGASPTAKGYRIAPADLVRIQQAIDYRPEPVLGEDEVRIFWTNGVGAPTISAAQMVSFVAGQVRVFCDAFSDDEIAFSTATGDAVGENAHIHPDDLEKARAWAKAREPKSEPVKVRWIDRGLEREDVVELPIGRTFPNAVIRLDGSYFDDLGVSVSSPNTKYIHPTDLPKALAEAERLRLEAGRE